MKKNPLNSFLSQLKLENKVIFRNKETNSYCIDFHEDIKKRIESIEPDAVYIFNSQPLILFFDLTVKERNLDELYKKVWSFDNTSIVFLIKEKNIEVFNALNYIKEKNLNTLEKIDLSKQEIKRLFNLWELESGKTWEWFQNKFIDKKKGETHSKRVNERLFSNIKQVREDLKDKNFTESEANSLILRLIFIRYLIDRKIKIVDQLISGKVNNLSERRKNFIQLIKQPKKLNKLFEILNNRFNGVLFKESDILLTQSQAEYLSGVFAGELDGDNSLFKGFFFEIFDFSIIPVEVISGIYESLIDEEKRKIDSAVYTPSFLVDYILKDTVDEFLKKNNPEDCTVFEVAVGSGIFLVQSLRRIIEKEIELNGKANNKAFAEKIKGFAENNLYGIDINKQALKVTCFSVYIALLDYLEPADINVYQFPELIGKNLFEANFFNKKHQFNKVIDNVQPKFILGNPPWKKDKSKEHLSWVNSTETYSKKKTGKLEIAQSFLLRTKEFMKEDTISSLIVTSTVFYNVSSTAKEFKIDFLTSFNLNKFFDLSPVRRLIFEEKNSPATVLTYKLSQNKDYNSNVLKHQSVKSNIFLKNFKILIIEKFDQKELLQKHFLENDWMFKVALYGNSLDFSLMKKIESLKGNLEDYLKKNRIIYGDGIKSNRGDAYSPYLIGIPLIEHKELKEYYTTTKDKRKINEDEVYYESGRKEGLFKGEHILIKAQATSAHLKFSYVKNDVAFRSDIFGFTSNNKNNESLKYFYSLLLSKIYMYRQFLISSLGIASRVKIRLSEHETFPIVQVDEKTTNALIALTNKFIESFEEYYKNQSEKIHSEFELKLTNSKESKPPINQDVLNQINEIINEVYEVKEYEKDLIDYALNISRYQFQESKQNLFTKRVDSEKEFLGKYAEVYLKEFSEIYLDEFIQIEIFPLEHFIAMNFVMKQEQPKKAISYSQNKDITSVLKTLANTLSISELVSTSDSSKNLFIQKDIKGFENNSFYIIKPNEYKCWHRAMAWYDVAEFKDAIQKAEIDELNASVE